MRPSHFPAVAVLTLASLPAQVFVVDAAGGAGSHFTDIRVAIATVPDGSTLRVRAGGYGTCPVTAKGIAIVGEGAVVIQGLTSVASTLPTQRVVLRRLQLTGGLSVSQASGPVALETCAIPLHLGIPATIDASRQVRLHDCQMWGGFYTPVLDLTRSTVEISRCVVGSGSIPAFEAPGIRASHSRCTLIESRVVGADGSSGYCWRGTCDSAVVGGDGGGVTACTGAAPGGPGIKADANCAIFVFGTLPAGGGFGGANGFPRAASYLLGAGSRLVHSPNVRTPVAWLTSIQARAQTVQIEVRAAPASPCSSTPLSSPARLSCPRPGRSRFRSSCPRACR